MFTANPAPSICNWPLHIQSTSLAHCRLEIALLKVVSVSSVGTRTDTWLSISVLMNIHKEAVIDET